MAKINVGIHERANNPQTEAILEIFISMINQINPSIYNIKDYPEGLPLATRQKLLDDAIANAKWNITTLDGLTWRISGPGVDISRVIVPQSQFLYHKYFELSKSLQGTKIADQVLRASLRITDLLKYPRINLHANLDVGGYAWLRKGAWPQGGIEELLDAPSRRRNPELYAKFERKFGSMSEQQAKNFVLSPEFREYKPLFLGADWQGRFDVNDPIVRTAMLQGAEVAYNNVVMAKPLTNSATLTSNQKIANEFVKHHLRTMGFVRGLAQASQSILDSSNSEIRDIILRYYNELPAPVNFSDRKNVKLLAEMEAEINLVRNRLWSEVNDNLMLELRQYARAEVGFASTVIQGAVPFALGLEQPSPAKLTAIVNSKPFEGKVLSEWLTRTGEYDIARITAAAKQGIVDGVTPTQAIRQLLGLGLRGDNAITKKAFTDLEAVLLTASAQIQNDARQELYAANGDLFQEEYFVATLDSRTTFECAGHDAERFKRGEGPMPPLHFRCRSLRVPYIGESIFNRRGFDSSTEPQLLKEFTEQTGLPNVKSRNDLPRGTKTKYDQFARKRARELMGQVPAKTSFNDWLKVQTPEFQNEYLGVKRAAEFRSGKFNIQDFVAPNGRTYRLEELGI